MRVDIVVPVFNEARTLAHSIRTLVEFLSRTCVDDWRVVIADNASTDGTPVIAADLAVRHSRLRSLRIEDKGRGRALRTAWGASDAEVHAYMDADLSTELPALLRLLERVREGYDIAIGSRHQPGAVLVRGFVRDALSRGYNRLLRGAFGTSISDAQCGFKAVSHRVVTDLLPFVESHGFFFDTELLLLAERAGYRIAEVPVRWVEHRDSSVRIVPTILEYLAEVRRVRRSQARIPGPDARPRVRPDDVAVPAPFVSAGAASRNTDGGDGGIRPR
jgi:glycosyltransferase involved in cell wall biosynthesis